MNLISELLNDARYIVQYRRQTMPIQRKLDRLAPKAGDMAPDFTLTDSSGRSTVTLSDWRGIRPVALVFGSFT